MYSEHIHRSICSRTTSYVDQMSAWYDLKTKQEIVNIKVFEKLEVRLIIKIFHVTIEPTINATDAI